jgi:hypothetical protein
MDFWPLKCLILKSNYLKMECAICYCNEFLKFYNLPFEKNPYAKVMSPQSWEIHNLKKKLIIFYLTMVSWMTSHSNSPTLSLTSLLTSSWMMSIHECSHHYYKSWFFKRFKLINLSFWLMDMYILTKGQGLKWHMYLLTDQLDYSDSFN